MIDCETVLELAENYQAEDVIESLRRRIDSHLETCAGCRGAYRAGQTVAAQLAAAPAAPQAGAWFADRLLSRLARDNDAQLERPGSLDPAQLSLNLP